MLPTKEENSQDHTGTGLLKIVNVFIRRNALTRLGGALTALLKCV